MRRNILFQMKNSERETEEMEILAKHYGLEKSPMIRMLIRKAMRSEGLQVEEDYITSYEKVDSNRGH